ncbi:MAG: hypothetical protein BWY11_00657 [Firmicutes bacterium ADurb.Bin182]|nr:MAG: hypothetical protein BWY11_00657 [Firmicutes bacterium ADurb.Bin182]
MLPKKELIRIVHASSREVSMDKTGKAHGRGAYICPKIKCLDSAIKSRALERAFECKIDASVIEGLQKEVLSYESN